MRKSFIYAAGLMCLALSITDCQKELVDQTTPASEPNFELFARPVTTKTANNGLDTKWVANDDINVFHAEAGSISYRSDGQFTVKDIETGRFDGKVSTSLSADKSYDWYAFYPYTSLISTPDNTASGYCYIGSRADASQTQTGDNNMSHICGSNYPLYGIAKNVNASDVPSIQMQHLTSVIKIVVTNSTEEELTLNSVSFTAEEDISGQFYIAFNSETPKYTSAGYPSKTANLTVSDVKVAANAKATVYMAIKPFTAKTGSTLKLAVNGYEKTPSLDNDITFTAGHIKPLNFNYDTSLKTATFNFADPESLGLTKPASGSGTEITASIINGGVTLAETDGSTKTRLWNKSGTCELRSYNGGTLSFSVEEGYIIKTITFTGNSIKAATADVGEYNDGTWQGESASVTFSIGKGGLQINSVIIVYEKDVVLPSLATPEVIALLENINSIAATWDAVDGAKDYTVTCGEQTITTAETKYTFKDLAYSTEYTISVVANPSDETTNAPSAAGKSEVVKTGANPAGGSTTYTLDSDAIKAAHSSAWSYTSGSKTITAKDGSKWTAYNTYANKNQITIQMNKGKKAYILTPKFDGKSITNIAIENVSGADGTGIGSKPIDILSADGKTTIASGISGETLTKGIVVDGTYDQLRIICNESNGGATYIKSIAIVVAD